MSFDADIPEAAPTPDAWAERKLEILSELAEAGLEIALALKARIVEASEPETGDARACPDLARAFDRASRAVRLSIALRDKLLRDAPTAQPARRKVQDTRTQRADRVRRIVGRVIRAQHKHSFLHETLDTRTRERLYDPDITGELEGRPIGELVSRICDDLGLWPRWRELAEEAWAQDEIAARPPGSPFAAWPELPPGALDFDELDREDPRDLDDEEEEDDGDGNGESPPFRRSD